MVLEISVEVDACPCPDESHDPWGIYLVIKRAHSIVGQSPQEEIMKVHRYAMDDIEQGILHDAYDIFFIIMALDRRKNAVEDSVKRPGFIFELMDQEVVLGGCPLAKGFMRTSIILLGSSRSS